MAAVTEREEKSAVPIRILEKLLSLFLFFFLALSLSFFLSPLLVPFYPRQLFTTNRVRLKVRTIMVSAWFMDDSNDDQRLDHHQNPPAFVDLDTLKDLTGISYWYLDPEKDKDKFDQVCKEHGITYKDELQCCPDKLPNYEEKLKMFFQEHLHADEEIRYVLEGSGFFDVRDINDKWIRIKVSRGDLLILPAGIYHRFTLDTKDYIRAMRLFVGDPVWTPINRPADDHPARLDYQSKYSSVKA